MTKEIIYKKFFNITILVISLGFYGCNNRNFNTRYIEYNQTQKTNKDIPQVVATTSVLCDLTKQVARETINLTCLIPPGLNPSIYQPTREDIQAIQQAQLILYHGYNFEQSLIKVMQNTKNKASKIAVAEIAISKPEKLVKNGISFTEPHIWHNVKNTIKMLKVVNSNLIKILPQHQKKYMNNTNTLTQELNELHTWIKSTLATIPDKNRRLLTTHEAMIYYVKAYNLPYKGSLPNINNNDDLTDAKMQNLAQYIQKTKVPIVFADTTINLMSLQPITTKANVKLFDRQLYIDGLGKPGSDGETYQKMMDANTRSIVEGLGGTYLKFEANIGR